MRPSTIRQNQKTSKESAAGSDIRTAVLYLRYSSHAQRDVSIDQQRREGMEFCAKEGLVVVGEYVDRHKSARNDARADFQRMLSDAKRKLFDYVVVWSFDRFARNRYDSAINKHELRKHGVKVLSVTERITDTPEGIILEGALESFAEFYSEKLRENIMRGQEENVIKGLWNGGPTPLGYKVVNQHLEIDKERAHIVRRVFEQYADGVAMSAILAELDEKGYKTRSGKPFSFSSFRNVLHNEIYTGVWMYNGVRVGDVPAIVDATLFDRVQTRLEATRRAPAKKKARENYLLTGKVFCGHCGANMASESGYSKNGSTYRYYSCTNRKGKAVDKCDKKNERKEELERFIVDMTVNYILDPVVMPTIVQKVVAEYNREFNDLGVMVLERQIEALNRKSSAAAQASLEVPSAVRDRYYKEIERYELQLQELETDLAKLRIACSVRLDEKIVTAWLKVISVGDPADKKYQERIIDVFVNSVFIYDDRIICYYNIEGGKQINFVDNAPEVAGEGVRISDAMLHQMAQRRTPIISKTALPSRCGSEGKTEKGRSDFKI